MIKKMQVQIPELKSENYTHHSLSNFSYVTLILIRKS